LVYRHSVSAGLSFSGIDKWINAEWIIVIGISLREQDGDTHRKDIGLDELMKWHGIHSM